MKQMSPANVFTNGHHPHHHHMNIPTSVQSSNVSMVNNNNQEKTLETWWNVRTNLEKLLLLSSLILSLLLIATVATFLITVIISTSNTSAYYYSKSGSNLKTSKSLVWSTSEPYTCLTPGCVKSASHIIESMDPMVDPCEDFYQFACGGWKETKYINEDQTGVTEFGALRENLNRKLRALIEKDSKPDEPIYNHMMRLMYRQCMNQSEIESYQANPLIEDIIHLGGWPVIEGSDWNEKSFDWITMTGKMRTKGFNHNILLAIFVGPDFKDSTKNRAQIDQGTLGVPDRKYLLKGTNDTVVKAYLETMVDTAIALGAKDKDRVEREMKQVLDFEIQLANVSIPMEARRNFTQLYNKMTLSEVIKLAPKINWRRLVDVIFDEKIPDDEEFVVKAPSYLPVVEKLILETSPRTLANYLIFRMAFSALPQLGKKYRKLGDKLDRSLTGKAAERPRWDTCMRRLYGTFGVPMSALYVKDHFDPASLEKANEMVKYIHQEFVSMLHKVDWMDAATKSRAIEKAKGIKTRIGYAPEILNSSRVMELFTGLSLDFNGTFYANVQTLRKYWTDYDMNKLREPYDKNDWKKFAHAATVNAFYNSLENSIKFPAGILQGIFFDKNRPDYLNYGAIGYIIGHEITHGFDDRGRQFDKDGNNKNWWEHETDAKFKEKAQCITDQYASFEATPEEKGLKLNGVNTLGENIADNGGIKQAFLGYQSFVRDKGPEPRLPGLDYTPNQLFWISSANIWCAKIRLQSLKLRIQTGVHSPPRFRVIGPMVNSPHFAESFNCKAGSTMNPANKCTVW